MFMETESFHQVSTSVVTASNTHGSKGKSKDMKKETAIVTNTDIKRRNEKELTHSLLKLPGSTPELESHT